MDNVVAPLPTQPLRTTKNKKPLLVIVIILIIALLAGLFLWRKMKRSNIVQTNVITTNQPSPTEKPKIDKQQVKIEVLNGTGTPGQAGSAVDALKKAGYNADNIKTGNAQDYTHTATTIDAKSGFEDIASDFKSALSSLFDNVTINTTPLASDNQFDIVVTTGGKIYQTPTPNATSSPTIAPTAAATSTPTPTSTLTPTPTP